MITEGEQAEAERAILDYLSERNEWERGAWKLGRSRRAQAAWPEVKETIRAGYAAILERHCATRVIALGLLPAYGNPPTVDPAGARIVSSNRDHRGVHVITEEETGDGLGPTTYEYELIEVDGQLRLAERRARFPDRRPIREVW